MQLIEEYTIPGYDVIEGQILRAVTKSGKQTKITSAHKKMTITQIHIFEVDGELLLAYR